MEGGGHQEGAINLSTVRDPSKDVEEQMNGEVTRNGENGHDTVPQRVSVACGFCCRAGQEFASNLQVDDLRSAFRNACARAVGA